MVQQNNVHESLRESVTASKEHCLSNAKPCDDKIALDFITSLEDVIRISIILTSRGSFHKYVRKLYSSGKHWPEMKPLLQERFSEYGNSTIYK